MPIGPIGSSEPIRRPPTSKAWILQNIDTFKADLTKLRELSENYETNKTEINDLRNGLALKYKMLLNALQRGEKDLLKNIIRNLSGTEQITEGQFNLNLAALDNLYQNVDKYYY